MGRASGAGVFFAAGLLTESARRAAKSFQLPILLDVFGVFARDTLMSAAG
jgi:hypothetical protein